MHYEQQIANSVTHHQPKFCVDKASFSENRILEQLKPQSCRSASKSKVFDINFDTSEILKRLVGALQKRSSDTTKKT